MKRSVAIVGLCLAGLLGLSACADRPVSGALTPNPAVAPGATTHGILVATTRERDARPGTFFNGERSATTNFAALSVSVPPQHRGGNVEWPSSSPGNPETDFVTRSGEFLADEKQFVARINQRLKGRPKGSRKILLFVHGYNTLFAEGLYRFTQIVHDSHAVAVPVFFSWASRGSTFDYLYDNNSALIARDGLERTLRLLLASDAEQVNVVAHSMGNWVTVEAIRQIRISGGTSSPHKVGTIVLAAPDLDIDLFKSEMRRIGVPKKPYLIVLSKDDRALGLSRFLSGDKERLGASTNTAELTALGAVVVDLTDVKSEDSTNHGKFAEIAAIAPDLNRVLAQGIRKPQGHELANTAVNALTLPTAIVTEPIRILSAR